MIDLSKYFTAAVTVDNVIFGFDDGDLKVLLIHRGEEPYEGYWALPGYFVLPDENLDQAAQRVLGELTGLRNVYLEQVYGFGEVNRHPVGRVITIAYYSLVKIEDFNLHASSIATEAKWFSVSHVGDLAFDHKNILDVCFQALKKRVRTRPVGFELLPPRFTLTDLQHLYEAILEIELDKRNFRKKIMAMDLLKDCNQVQERVAHRPARLYSFDQKRYESLMASGLNFEI